MRTILAMSNLAVVYREKQVYAKAQALLQRSIELEEANGNIDPFSLDFARYHLATVAFDTKDYQTAEDVFLLLLDRYRSNPEAIRLYLELPNQLALLYQEQGREQEDNQKD